jgi:inosine-uridine nucleoside N-ribohydrolase
MPSALQVIIDTDPGIDDVVALALAARSPALDVLAVTTTYGNATLAQTTRNARTLLGLMGQAAVPIHAGAERPLTRNLVTAPRTHGPTGVGYAAVAEPEPVRPNPTVLADVLETCAASVTLVTLGPLTNLAHALAAAPDTVHSRVSTHIGMFGSLRERGGTDRWADFNAWCDPEAADRVIRSDLRTVAVGLDVTRQMILSPAEVDRLCVADNPLALWLGNALQFSVEYHTQHRGVRGCVVNDVLPIGELICPGLLQLARTRLAVDLGDGENRGRTRKSATGGSVELALGADIDKMKRMLRRVTKEA